MTALTEQQWRDVFAVRCRAKRGESLSSEDSKLITIAWKEDPKRYAELDAKVFEATKPFGAKP